MKSFLIVTFDGGGVRGQLSARLWARLTARLPWLADSVSLYAGTSTGGIIACGLAHGLEGEQLVALYREHIPRVFKRRLFGPVIGAKYSAKPLRTLLEETFRTTTLGELRTPVLIPTLDLDAPADLRRPRQARAKFFESRGDATTSVVDALMATSAAPSFFPSWRGFVDGGLVANSPVLHAIAQALQWGVSPEQIRVLSIGTGMSPGYIEGEELDWGALRWAPHVPGLTIDAVAGASGFIARRVFGGFFHRLDGFLPRPIALDDASALEELVEAADRVELEPALGWLTTTLSEAA